MKLTYAAGNRAPRFEQVAEVFSRPGSGELTKLEFAPGSHAPALEPDAGRPAKER